jgi:hypothetical protein
VEQHFRNWRFFSFLNVVLQVHWAASIDLQQACKYRLKFIWVLTSRSTVLACPFIHTYTSSAFELADLALLYRPIGKYSLRSEKTNV